MAFPWLTAALTGVSALTGALQNRSRTQQSSSTTTNTASQSGTSTVRRTLLPEQEALMGPYSQRILDMIQNPASQVNPLRDAARSRVNAKYAAAPQAIRDKYGAGTGASGKFGMAARQAEFARLGELGGVDSEFDRAILDMQERGMGFAQNLMGMNFGQDVSTSATSSGTQSFQGLNVLPGNALAGGVGGAAETLMTLLMLNKMLEGSGIKGIR